MPGFLRKFPGSTVVGAVWERAILGLAVVGGAALLWHGTVKANSADTSWQSSNAVRVSNAITGGHGSVSTARCGSAIVVGFGDVESGKPNSWDGFSFSKDGGATFTEGGTLPAAANDFLGTLQNLPTDPVNLSVACSSAGKFYYASAGSIGNFAPGFAYATISVSTSIDGGARWSLPNAIASRLIDTEILLAPSISVDPADPYRVYVAYLHEYTQGPIFLPGGNCLAPAYALELLSSGDGGHTWQSPVAPIDYACFPDTTAQHTGTLGAPTLTVSPSGKVYVAYEFIGQNPSIGQPTHNEIRFTRSVNQGSTFSAPVLVSTDAIKNAPLQIAVDRTSLRSRGTIYLSWPGSPTGTYTDVLVSDSVSFGVSFSFPRSISPAPPAGVGRFQTNPVLAVDSDGEVADCFYSTASSVPSSSSVYSYNCATSFNQVASWVLQRVASSAPVGFNAITGDLLLHDDGFFTAFELTSSGQKHVFGAKGDLN